MNEKIKQAEIVGAEDFAAGNPRIPALSKKLNELRKTGNAIALMRAWCLGWDRANIAAPVPESVDYKALGFRDTGFGCTTRECKISVWIVRRQDTRAFQYGVYIFHGAPAGRFWRNSSPLCVFETETAARRCAEIIFGISGSGQFAQLVDY